MKKSKILLESQQVFLQSKVDREKKLIKNVVILGQSSKNKRKYLNKAMNQGVNLFENKPAYFEHGKKQVRDLIGKFTDVKLTEDSQGSKQLRGTLHVLEKELWVLDLAERMSDIAGFSINADGLISLSKDKNLILVEELTEADSVDLVTKPATTKGLFEEIEDKKNMEEVEILKKKLLEMEKAQEEKNKEVKKSLALLEEENKTLKEQIKLEEEKKKLKEKQEKLEKTLQENKLDLSPTMKDILLRSEEDEQKKLLEELINMKKPLKIASSDRIKEGSKNKAELSEEEEKSYKNKLKEEFGG